MLVALAHGQIRGQPVQINRSLHGPRRIVRILRQQAGDQPGEQVAAAAFGHAGIAGSVHGHAAIGMRDQRSRAFEHQRHAHALRKAARGLQPVRLNFGDGDSGQPRHLAGMRREHQRASLWPAS